MVLTFVNYRQFALFNNFISILDNFFTKLTGNLITMRIHPSSAGTSFSGTRTSPPAPSVDTLYFSGTTSAQTKADYIARLLEEDCGAGIKVGDVYSEILRQLTPALQYERDQQNRKSKCQLIRSNHANKPWYKRWFTSPSYPRLLESPKKVSFGEIYTAFSPSPQGAGRGFAETAETKATQLAIKRLIENGLIHMATIVYSNYPKKLFINGAPIPHYSGSGLVSPVGLKLLDKEVAQGLVDQGKSDFEFMTNFPHK